MFVLQSSQQLPESRDRRATPPVRNRVNFDLDEPKSADLDFLGFFPKCLLIGQHYHLPFRDARGLLQHLLRQSPSQQ